MDDDLGLHGVTHMATQLRKPLYGCHTLTVGTPQSDCKRGACSCTSDTPNSAGEMQKEIMYYDWLLNIWAI